jgi:hypothetical protein
VGCCEVWRVPRSTVYPKVAVCDTTGPTVHGASASRVSSVGWVSDRQLPLGGRARVQRGGRALHSHAERRVPVPATTSRALSRPGTRSGPLANATTAGGSSTTWVPDSGQVRQDLTPWQHDYAVLLSGAGSRGVTRVAHTTLIVFVFGVHRQRSRGAWKGRSGGHPELVPGERRSSARSSSPTIASGRSSGTGTEPRPKPATTSPA